ncbi:sugar phosphate isomerase/epimerase family protein [uncultured Cohaesibacter sp.]|uniref:sugar phosphate isomerase/epimerase family protein n=1 Tax=uncultured Cohaesibacter sp. TaxID=1002546 RepID=UPI002930C522|nr:sugar phosphate isomerase/epimerase family protein [uncultured Cohaesibacter sp.]
MLPLKIGACLRSQQIADHRDWLFDDARDLELQDFLSHDVLMADWKAAALEAKAALVGFSGRLGIHGPYAGLDIDNKDPELQALITRRFLVALQAAELVGARQMVLHSPYRSWYYINRMVKSGYEEDKLDRIHTILDPVVARAEEVGIVIVIENIEDSDPSTRRNLVDSFHSDAIALSIDTGHAHVTRHNFDAPPVDFFVRDAGDQLRHVHLQDVDGYCDRHWAPGEGDIKWQSVFDALSDCNSAPHLVLELRDKTKILQAFEYLKSLGLVC